MALKPRVTQAEAKERARAVKEDRPYYKRIYALEKSCPHCNSMLRDPFIHGYIYGCVCSLWKYDFITHKLSREKRGD